MQDNLPNPPETVTAMISITKQPCTAPALATGCIPYWIAALWLTLFLSLPVSAWAGGIRGVLKDEQGHPIRRGALCLMSEASVATWQCIKSGYSARNGKYAFANLRKGTYYVLVRRIDASGPNYAWLPSLQLVILKKNSSIIKYVDFNWLSQGAEQGFKFNNFRYDQPLTAANFPELAEFDTVKETVILKLYIPTVNPEVDEQNLFLGQVGNPEALSINPSVPNTVTTLNYEIFSPSRTVSGTLTLE